MPNQRKSFIIMNPMDNCATALNDIIKHTKFDIEGIFITINHDIPLGHKFALKKINKNEHAIKYGQFIGVATEDIMRGDWIHTHNLVSEYLKEVSKK